ncbi:Anaphase-promoting complex (APC), subunit 11 [Handroanthus impetiginosus]|uniref:Anaphase-promoting complex (APC), subunit 11 n=1 Tax=Handroanthus impetiginosus TaxID=429701 RepID=A0A2G9HZK3_9LAMI|nr:Anaphase-promoting complex (APC), subunit 11 [Handroanthus impetiginosus]
MAPPAWLPPLNSHENSVIDVLISESPTPDCSQINANDIPSNFYIGLHVYVSFHPEDDVDMKIEFPGLSVRIIKPVNVENPEILVTSLLDIILDEDIIPFQLEDFFYREYNLHGNPSSWFYFSHPNILIEKLKDFILLVHRKPENAGRKLVGVNVEIRRSVTVPKEEFESWVNWYDEQKRVYPDFEEEYMRAISVPRDPDDVLDESVSLMWRRSARRTIVRELESVVVKVDDDGGGDSSEKSCSICLEEFRPRARATRLPCRHVFHEHCIGRWLAGNHVCPLCRRRLPID